MTIDVGKIQARLTTEHLGRAIVHMAETASTNSDAMALANGGAAHGTLVIAERQTNGRGRRGRTWLDERGESITMSVIIRPNTVDELAPRYTPLAAIAVVRTVNGYGVDARIKWPNDVLINEKKLCGILMELGGDSTSRHIICGIGINANQERFPEEICGIATSLHVETGGRVERERLIADIMNNLEPLINACGDEAEFSTAMEEYRRLSCTYGQKVDIIGADGVLSGTAADFDGLGRILLDTGGGIVAINSGDVSLRRRD